MSGVKFNKISGIRVSQETWEGRKYDRLKPLGHRFKIGPTAFVVCQCACGRASVPSSEGLVAGNSNSCGCRTAETSRTRSTTHGMSHSGEYQSWASMKERCLNPNYSETGFYRGRGIEVCERWRKSFQAFLDDMGPKPSPQHSIDRYPDINGNYEPNNCRWATPKQQANNTRRNIRLTIDGVERTVAEWLPFTSVNDKTIYRRLKLGWEPRRAVFGETRKMSARRLSRIAIDE